MKIKIADVVKNSIAYEAGIEKNDFLLSIDKEEIRDIIDYILLTSDELLTLEIEKPTGEIWEVELEKDFDESLGLVFEHETIDKPRECKNNCIFCFMAQMPKGMRKTLTFKDDDYRLSFTDGNYITLTNVSDEELERVVKLNLSPLNISVHTTNPTLREQMMRNPKAKDILKRLEFLDNNHIAMNLQLVLCPNINDGPELKKTLSDLLKFNNIQSISAVPVGLSKYRDSLYKLSSFTKEQAKNVIDTIEAFQNEFLKKTNSRTIYPSDEFFILAERSIPDTSYYEEFLQYENGVGMLSSLLEESKEALSLYKGDASLKKSFTVITGKLSYDYIEKIAENVREKFPNVKIKVKMIENNFFGEKITVTGLLTAEDIIVQTKEEDLFERVLLCSNMFYDNLTLDDMTKEELSEKLNRKIITVNNDGFELIKTLCGGNYE